MEEEAIGVGPTYRGNIWCTPQERMDWRLYLTELADDPKNHFEGVDMIREAKEEDVIEIFITSPGGRIDIADMYLAAFRDSKAKIITRAIGECASAATTVFLGGDERVCEDGCYFMFHNVQMGGMGGDSANVFSRTKFYERLFKDKFYGLMSEVLTRDELEELFERAGEVYLTAEEMRERLAIADSDKPQTTDWNGETGIALDFGKMQVIRNGATKGEDTASRIMREIVNGPTVEAVRQTGAGIVQLPFPTVRVKSADDFPQGDEFDIILDEGYKKTFRISTLRPSDFDEYNMDEIEEIGVSFGLDLDQSQNTRQQAIECLIGEIQAGDQFYIGEED